MINWFGLSNHLLNKIEALRTRCEELEEENQELKAENKIVMCSCAVKKCDENMPCKKYEDKSGITFELEVTSKELYVKNKELQSTITCQQKALANLYNYAVYRVNTQDERVVLKEMLLEVMTEDKYKTALQPQGQERSCKDCYFYNPDFHSYFCENPNKNEATKKCWQPAGREGE